MREENRHDKRCGPRPCEEGSRLERYLGTCWWGRWLFPLVGLCSLVWFVLRVAPKPTRATYPCQRVAFPLATGFLAWLGAVAISVTAIRKAAHCFLRARYVLCATLVGVAVGGVCVTWHFSEDAPAMADPPLRNSPIGVAKGLHPGRVAWVHDPDVTDWDGLTGDDHWWFERVDAAVARQFVSRAVRGYTGIDDDGQAWDAIFRHFNEEKGKGPVGYSPGEKITVKINLVACFANSDRVDANYDKSTSWKDNIDNPPDLIYGLLDQLVNIVGASQSDIWIGDPTGLFPNYMYDLLHPDFPGVHYWDNRGTLGRTRAEFSTKPFYWSKPGTDSLRRDYVPVAYAQAAYVINFAILKSHDLGGITVCGKNHYGSLLRLPVGDYRDANGVWHGPPSNPRYYVYHDDLPNPVNELGHYRNRVDFMGHDDIGGKTILYLIDGIIAGENWSAEPERWTLAPFDRSGGWPCSLFASMDPVAIDSVALDFLVEQWPGHAGMVGTADYLIEAALADDPPSGTFYDPNHMGAVSRIPSQGVYERWNNPTDKQYSRNLDPENGTGIELLLVGDDHRVIARAGRAPVIDGSVEGVWQAAMWRLFPHVIDPRGGVAPEGGDLAGRWKAMWDDEHLYILVEVTDDVLVHSPAHDTEYWCDDNVSVYIDGDNAKGGGLPTPNYDGVNDFAFGFRWGDPVVRLGPNSRPDTSGILFAMPATAGGYRLEAAIPWTLVRAEPASLPPAGPGTAIGLDVHVTDNDQEGDYDRDVALAWYGQRDTAGSDAGSMATVYLTTAMEDEGVLTSRADTWRYRKGTGEASEPKDLWRTVHFADGDWPSGSAPFGYGDPPYGVTLSDMRGNYRCVFLRRRFDLPAGLTISGLAVTANFDDGFIAWVNGVEACRANVSGDDISFDDNASRDHESGTYRRFSVPGPYDYLLPKGNVLAVQGFNTSLGDSSDFKLDVELSYKGIPGAPRAEGFVRGDANGDGRADISDAIHMLLALFAAGDPSDCEDARDANDDGKLDIADPVALLGYLFQGRPKPPPPFPDDGVDATPDSLTCERLTT